MCIRGVTKKGIDELPECGVYYKILLPTGRTSYYPFYYPLGKTVNIPENKQLTYYKRRYGATTREVIAGGHFYRYKKDAEYLCGTEHQVAAFRIHRKNITHIGFTRIYGQAMTILANKARRIR